MRYISYFFAGWFLLYGMLMAFSVVPIDKFFIGCMSVICCLSFIDDSKINLKGKF